MSTPAPAPQNVTTTEKGKGTSYVVLVEDGNNYALYGTLIATSAAAAIRKAADQGGAATYVAVPARSFVPTKVTVETTKTVKLG